MGKSITKRRANTRDRLLQAAYEVFVSNGFAGSSIELITNAAGYTRGAFYSNFSSKEELFVALAKREFTRRMDAVAVAIERIHELPEREEGISSTIVADLIASAMGRIEEEREWQIMLLEFRLFAWHHPEQAVSYRELYEDYIQSIGDFLVPAFNRLGIKYAIDPSVANRVLVSSFMEALGETFMTPEGTFDSKWLTEIEWYTQLVNRMMIIDPSEKKTL